MSNDIRSILDRLATVEGRLSPAQQRVPQLPALFKPKHIRALGSKTDPDHPMDGYMVGDSVANDQEVVEDVINTVKRSFGDYLKNLERELKNDPDLKDRVKSDSDLKTKTKKDSDLIAKKKPVKEDPTQQQIQPEPRPSDLNPTIPTINPTLPEDAPVKTVTIGDSAICEIHGNEQDGFEIRRGPRRLPTKFKNLEEAEMALAVYQHRRPKQHHQSSDDYIDERDTQDESMGHGTLAGENYRK